jgi:hypothetical protein
MVDHGDLEVVRITDVVQRHPLDLLRRSVLGLFHLQLGRKAIMALLSVLISIAVLILLVARIARLSGGSSMIPQADPFPLPDRTADEVERMLAEMPTRWVTYNGMTPPLQLKVRAVTEELYRRFTRAQMDAIGQKNIATLPFQERMKLMQSFLPDINARAYVLDWQGAAYPNGQPLPYTPDHLAILMRNDELLRLFVTDEAGRLAQEHGIQ